MENLEIISTQITVLAKQNINDNTANFSWNYKEGDIPQAINFNVQRGLVSGDHPFMGNNIISGSYYPESEKFDIQNNNFCEGDLDIYAIILATCKSITTPIVKSLKL